MTSHALRSEPGLSALATPRGLEFTGDPERLDALAEAHACIEHPAIAPVIARSEGTLVFECDAVSDVATALASPGFRVPYPAGIAFNEWLMDALEAGHAAGQVLGGLAYSDILVSPGGRLWLFGFGGAFFARSHSACIAPEVLLGAPPTEASDVYVAHAILRHLLPYAELLPLLREAASTSDSPLRDALLSLGSDAQAADPAARPPSIAALRSRYRAIRTLAGGRMPEPDVDGLRALVAAAVAPRTRLVVDRGRRSVALPNGTRLDLSRRRSAWAVLMCLVDARLERPGDAVPLDDLLAAGWPGERILPEAARARVYVMVSSLRKLGLREWLLKREDGYLLGIDLEPDEG